MTRAEHAMFIKGLEAARRTVAHHGSEKHWNPDTEEFETTYHMGVVSIIEALSERIRRERKKARAK